MNDSDWRDPFEDEEAAGERERRRAERAARRREREGSARESLGERVRSQRDGEAEADAAPQKPSSGSSPEPGQPQPSAPVRPSQKPEKAPPPPAPVPSETADSDPVEVQRRGETADSPPVTARGDTTDSHAVVPAARGEATDSYDLLPPADFDHTEAPGPTEWPTSAERIVARRGSKIRRRRLLGLVVAIILLGIVGIGGYAITQRGSNAPPPAKPVKPRKTETVTIPEGYTREQMAAVAKKAKLKGNYTKASLKSKKINLADYGAKNAKDLEGFLFPATYELFKNATAQDLVDKQVEAFKENFDGIDMSYAKSKNLSPYDVTIIASMIEREIQKPSERKLAASVIYNRLKAGTPLGIDATIRYEDNNFTKPLLESRLQADTPYNTRINAGLPPGPISNPGLDSLEAAANPAKTSFFFYVVKPGACGEHVFVKTQAEFDQATADYNNARDAAGGNSPTTC